MNIISLNQCRCGLPAESPEFVVCAYKGLLGDIVSFIKILQEAKDQIEDALLVAPHDLVESLFFTGFETAHQFRVGLLQRVSMLGSTQF